MAHTGGVRVVFADAGSGRELWRTELDAARLPESFDAATRMEIGGVLWEVVRADPPTAREFTASGSLTLMLTQVPTVDPRTIAYSLPTFYEPLPPLTSVPRSGNHFVIHEDDWRQTELVSRRVADIVEAELAQIRRIYDEDSRVVGEGPSALRVFERLHLRRAPLVPLPDPVPCHRLSGLLPAPTHTYTGVGCGDGACGLADSFATALGPLTLYGQIHADTHTVLALAPSTPGHPPLPPNALSSGLSDLMREFDLLLVDWVPARSYDADTVGDWLRELPGRDRREGVRRTVRCRMRPRRVRRARDRAHRQVLRT